MKPPVRIACLLLCGIALGGIVSAQTVYKSIGPDGRVVYSDHAPTSGHLEKTMKFENLPASALPASAASFMENFRRTHPAGANDAQSTSGGGATLYSASWCGYCKQAKAWLAARGVTYREVDVDSPNGVTEFAQATGGGGAIPVLFTKGRRINGFSAAAYEAVFAARP